MKKQIAAVLWVLMICLMPLSVSAALLTGELQGVQGSMGAFYFGDGVNDLFQEWSVNQSDCCGWFYGSAYGNANADVFVYVGLTDPTAISDASVFDYFDSATQSYPGPYGASWAAWVHEGDTVFFRGVNGRYGAWYIKDISFDPSNPVDFASLNGTWYFLDDGSADFTTTATVPLPGSLLLLFSGIAALVGMRAGEKMR